MNPKSFMLIAGEPSGDLLAAELVLALRDEIAGAEAVPTWDYQPLHASFEPRFFGAGGGRMAAAGVELLVDMMPHSVVGLSDVARHYSKLRKIFHQLYRVALDRQPDAIICVDYSGFNGRFAHAIRRCVSSHRDWFHAWEPKIIQYVSPQVWASRPGRAYRVASDFDLVLSIIPFEKAWYAERVPQLNVEFVGHPILDRYQFRPQSGRSVAGSSPSLLLLPGSRPAELARHLPVMLGALTILRQQIPGIRPRLVLPNQNLVQQAERYGLPTDVTVQAGGLADALADADVAIASTGTVTLECGFFGLPTVAIYKTSWVTYQFGRRLATVKYLAMPNLLAKEPVFPEFIQDDATSENVAKATLELLRDEQRRARTRIKLGEIVAGLGSPGASKRAARAIAKLVAPALPLSGSLAVAS